MKGILIFDNLNDVLFTKCDKKFAFHIQKLARAQGLITENKVYFLTLSLEDFNLYLICNVLIQLVL